MYRHITTLILSVALTAALAACSSMREGMEGHKDAVAVAGGYALSIDHAAELIAMAPDSIAPTRVEVVDRTVSLWVGYTVLATEYDREDQYSGLDLTPLIRFGAQQGLVWTLRDQVVAERVIPDEATLREWYVRDGPFTRVRTSHILIRVPAEATGATVDSLRLVTENLRERILAGESFESVAATHSEDPSSGQKGGDLGWIQRQRLVPEIDQVIFDMEIDKISSVLRTMFGFHIVKVTGREVPDFDDVRDDYEEHLASQRNVDVQQTFVDSIAEAADVRLAPGVVQLVRLSAFSSRLTRLGSAERSAALVRFKGGEVTFGQWAHFVMRGGPNAQSAFASSDTAAVADLLQRLAMNEVLAVVAREAGHTITPLVSDSLETASKRDLRTAALSAGFQPVLVREGRGVPAAVDNAFDYMLVRRRSPQSLDRVLSALHHNGPSILIHPYRYKQVLARLAELRGEIAGDTGRIGGPEETGS